MEPSSLLLFAVELRKALRFSRFSSICAVRFRTRSDILDQSEVNISIAFAKPDEAYPMIRLAMSPCRLKLNQKFEKQASGRAMAKLPNPVTAVAKWDRPCAHRMDQQMLPNDKVETARPSNGIMSPSNRCSV